MCRRGWRCYSDSRFCRSQKSFSPLRSRKISVGTFPAGPHRPAPPSRLLPPTQASQVQVIQRKSPKIPKPTHNPGLVISAFTAKQARFFTSSTELLTTPLSRLSWVNLGHSYMKASDTMPSIRDAYGAGAAVGPRIIARRVGRRRGLPAEHRFPISVRPLLASNREPIVTRGAMALLLISSASYTSSRAPYILDSFHLCRRCLFGSWLYHTLFPVSRCTRTS